jgi:hypothetical protein
MAAQAISTWQAVAATTVTIPTHRVGDVIVIASYRDGSTTTPTKPAASGTVPAWVDITNNTGANTNSMRTAYFIATATNHTSGTWTNATGMAAAVVENFRLGAPIGAATESGGTQNGGATCPAITLQDATGNSLVICIMGHRTVSAWSAAPSGYTSKASSATEIQIGIKNVSTSSGAISWTATTTNSGYRGAQIEIRARIPCNPAPNHQNPAYA